MRAWRWLAPAVVGLLVLTAWPLGRAVWTSLHRSSLSTPQSDPFVGVDNYTDVLGSRTWWLSVAVTLAIVVVSVLVQLGLGLVFAAALRRLTVAWPVTRVLVLLPFALLSVTSAVVWRDAVTTGFARDWFGIDDAGVLQTLVAVSAGEAWRGTGIVTVILLAGLYRVSPSLLAAAYADGATGWQRVRLVVLPAVGPALAVAATYRALDAFRTLEGPLLVDETASDYRTASLQVWNATFSSFELGLGAAMSIILLVLAAVLGLVMVTVFRVRRVL